MSHRHAIVIFALVCATAPVANASQTLRCEALFDHRASERLAIEQIVDLRIEADVAHARGDLAIAKIFYGDFKRALQFARITGLDLAGLGERLRQKQKVSVEHRELRERQERAVEEAERDLSLIPRPIAHLFHGQSAISTVLVNADGTRMLSHGTGATMPYVWDARTHQPLFQLKMSGFVSQIELSGDRTKIVVQSTGEESYVFDMMTGTELRKLKGTNGKWAKATAFSSDANRAIGADEGTVSVWEASSDTPAFELIDGPAQTTSAARAEKATITPDGNRALIQDSAHDVTVWDLNTKTELFTLKGHAKEWKAVNFSADGKMALIIDDSGLAILWDIANGRELARLVEPGQNIVQARFSPDGQRIVTGGNRGSVRVWNVADGKELFSTDVHRGGITAIDFDSTGARMALGSYDGSYSVWKMTDHKLLWHVPVGPGIKSATAYTENSVLGLAFGGPAKVATERDDLFVSAFSMKNPNLGLTVWRPPR